MGALETCGNFTIAVIRQSRSFSRLAVVNVSFYPEMKSAFSQLFPVCWSETCGFVLRREPICRKMVSLQAGAQISFRSEFPVHTHHEEVVVGWTTGTLTYRT